MDSESKTNLVSRESRKSWTGLAIAIVILSLLLSATVSTIIYMSVTERSPATTKGEKISVDVNVNKDGNKMQEKIDYDEKRNIAFTYTPNGDFVSAEDLGKGFNIIKDQGNGMCYVVPTGTDKTAARDLKKFLKEYDGEDISLKEQLYKTQLMPGEIDDESFLPDEAKEACDGFQWLSVVDEEAPNENYDMAEREKRATATCSYICWVNASTRKLYIYWWGYCTLSDFKPCYDMFARWKVANPVK